MVTALLEGDDADLLKHPPVFSQLWLKAFVFFSAFSFFSFTFPLATCWRAAAGAVQILDRSASVDRPGTLANAVNRLKAYSS